MKTIAALILATLASCPALLAQEYNASLGYRVSNDPEVVSRKNAETIQLAIANEAHNDAEDLKVIAQRQLDAAQDLVAEQALTNYELMKNRIFAAYPNSPALYRYLQDNPNAIPQYLGR